jgi:hypothetical protein
MRRYISKEKDNPTNFRRHVAFPFKTVFAGSRQPCGLPLSQRVRRVVVNPFGLTMYLLPHCVSHASPWAQQAFTCCADPDDESALFFGWSEPYFRQTAIYAFLGKFLNKSPHISRLSV